MRYLTLTLPRCKQSTRQDRGQTARTKTKFIIYTQFELKLYTNYLTSASSDAIIKKKSNYMCHHSINSSLCVPLFKIGPSKLYVIIGPRHGIRNFNLLHWNRFREVPTLDLAYFFKYNTSDLFYQ